uniref:GST N-terminal domain-containing protein n=1 Tax=Spermophilus dauricus TaxID=99837 RepID=A0A8C9PUL9_SPEDA
MPMILGYWDVRGLTNPIRLLLEYTDSSYEEKRYTMGDAPNYDRSQWLDEKFKLGLDFPNVGGEDGVVGESEAIFVSSPWSRVETRLWTLVYNLP